MGFMLDWESHKSLKHDSEGLTLNEGLEGRVAKWKTWIFWGLANCTEGWVGRLY